MAAQAELIQDLLSDPWWVGVTVSLLELVRVGLRDLVQHIETGKKAVLHTSFADEIGSDLAIDPRPSVVLMLARLTLSVPASE